MSLDNFEKGEICQEARWRFSSDDRRRLVGELVCCECERTTVRLHRASAAHLIFQAEFQSSLVADRLAQVRFWDEENRLLTEGCLGLYPVNDGQAAMGEIRLDLLNPDFSATIGTRLGQFGIVPQLRRKLSDRDRGSLERSLWAAVQPASRKVLKEVLQTLGKLRAEHGVRQRDIDRTRADC
jgi:hypothetical protein